MSPLDPLIVWWLRASLALLLFGHAVAKARALRHFAATLADYRLLPPAAARPAALGLCAAESATAAALLVPASAAQAALAAALLFALYAFAIAVNLIRGRRDIDCGCAGPAAQMPLSGALVVRNALLVAAAIAAAAPLQTRPLGAIDAFTFSAALAMGVLLWKAAHGLLENAPALARLRRPQVSS